MHVHRHTEDLYIYPSGTGFQHINAFVYAGWWNVIGVITFGWSLTGTATRTATFIGLSRVMSNILLFSEDIEPEIENQKQYALNSFEFYE